MFENWKSTMAFMVFVGAYIYAIAQPLTAAVVATSGNIALIASIFMMMRSQITSDMLSKLIDVIGSKK